MVTQANLKPAGDYIPSIQSMEFIAFIRAAAVEDNSNAEIHYKLADKYFSKDKQILIESFRGSAKSTIMEWLVIFTAAKGELPGFGKVNFIAFVGDSAENGVKNFFRNIAAKIDNSPFLQQFITVQRKTDSEMELVNVDGRELNLKGYGANSNIRGVRYKNARPDVIIVDDITTNDAMGSEAVQRTIDDNFFKSILPAMHPTRYKIFVIGTPISEKDIIHQLANNPRWTVHKFPICEKFPCDPSEFVGYWEDRFPYEAVLDKYETLVASGKSKAFYQEYMLQLTDLTTLVVAPEDIMWFDPTTFMKNKHMYNYYIVTDFATSTKKAADFSTIGVIAIASNGAWFLIDGQCKRQTMQENLEDLFMYARKWKPLSVGIESSGQQGGFISILNDMMVSKNIWFHLAKKRGSKEVGIRPTTKKLQRFVTGVAPMFEQHRVWLPRPEICQKYNPDLYGLVIELEDELSKLTMTGGVEALAHDDALDLLNQLSEMDVYAPSDDTFTAVEEGHTRDKVMHDPWEEYQEENNNSGGSNLVF